MKILSASDEGAMLSHWRCCEGRQNEDYIRKDIIHDDFPRDATWYIAEIEKADIPQMFLISVHDLGPISCNTWRLSVAAENYEDGFTDNDHSLRIQSLIEREHFDPKVIVVSHDVTGPFTIIDGNHRAILLMTQNQFVGQECFLGIHPMMRKCDHAGKAYQNWRLANPR